MTELQTFLTMLAHSDEIYKVEFVGHGRIIEFRVREIGFMFDKDGKFDKIIKLKS